MARKRAESMDQASFWAVNAAGAPGKRCRPTMASPRTGRMIGFAPFQGFIRGMSGKGELDQTIHFGHISIIRDTRCHVAHAESAVIATLVCVEFHGGIGSGFLSHGLRD